VGRLRLDDLRDARKRLAGSRSNPGRYFYLDRLAHGALRYRGRRLLVFLVCTSQGTRFLAKPALVLASFDSGDDRGGGGPYVGWGFHRLWAAAALLSRS